MFDIAQIDTRTLQLHLTPVDISIIIKDVATQLEKAIQERQQSMSIEIPPLPQIKADPNLMEKLFQHLLNNAIKFTPDNGKIKVIAKPAAQGNELPNGGVEIIISDSGVGVDPCARSSSPSSTSPANWANIPPARRASKAAAQVWDWRYQKASSRSHGGRIWVESAGYDEVNFPGSHFHVTLPMSKEETMAGTELNLKIP
jgi:signal transduction histidine kinase